MDFKARAMLLAPFFCLLSILQSQSLPDFLTYQAIVRDGTGKPLNERSVELVLEIKKAGSAVYSETHDLVTSPFGLVTAAIGSKKPTEFEQIDWKNGPFTLRAALSGPVSLETESPFQAVPFAFVANEVLNERQSLALNGNELSIAGGNAVTLPTSAVSPWQATAGGISHNGSVGIGSTDFSNNIGFSVQKNAAFRDAAGAARLTAYGLGTGAYYLALSNAQNDQRSELGSQADGSAYLLAGSQSKAYFQAQSFPDESVFANIVNKNLVARASMGLENNASWALTRGPSGKIGAELLSVASGENVFHVHDQNEALRIEAAVPAGSEPERFALFSSSGKKRAEVAAYGSSAQNGGAFTAYGPTGNERASLFSGSEGEGFLRLFDHDHDPASHSAVGAEISARNALNGAGLRLFAPDGSTAAALFVDQSGLGQLQLTGAKNFVQDHPTDPSKQLVFASIEGPEAAVYLRGTARMERGAAKIDFPEAFRLVIGSPETMTVQVTPRSEKSRGLAVVERSETGFTVKEMGLKKRFSTRCYDFDWEAKAIRKGFEDFEAIRSKPKN